MGTQFLRTMPWLGADRVRGYLALFAVVNVATLAWLVAGSSNGVDANGFLLGTDFISFWTTGAMLHAGGDPYDLAAHMAAQRTVFAARDAYTAFYYPPAFLPVCWLLACLPYFPALGCWLLATGTGFVAALRPWLARARLELPSAWLLAAFPAMPLVITHGQTTFLVGALLACGLWLVPRRPLLAGLLIGLATMKPQLGLLVPVALLLAGRWRVIAGAAASALALCATAIACFGIAVVPRWMAAADRAQEAMAAGSVPFGKMVSAFAAARLLGAPVGLAYAVQAIVALAVVAALGVAARRMRGWTGGTAALVLAGAPLMTPFVLDYDLALLAFPLAWLAGQGLRHGFLPWEKFALLLVFALPAFARPLALDWGIPVAVPVLALFFAIACRRATVTQPASFVRLDEESKGTDLG